MRGGPGSGWARIASFAFLAVASITVAGAGAAQVPESFRTRSWTCDGNNDGSAGSDVVTCAGFACPKTSPFSPDPPVLLRISVNTDPGVGNARQPGKLVSGHVSCDPAAPNADDCVAGMFVQDPTRPIGFGQAHCQGWVKGSFSGVGVCKGGFVGSGKYHVTCTWSYPTNQGLCRPGGVPPRVVRSSVGGPGLGTFLMLPATAAGRRGVAWGLLATTIAGVGLASGLVGAQSYVGGGGVTVTDPTTGQVLLGCGVILCQDGIQPGLPPAGIGGVCAIDCNGANTDCTVTNTSADSFTLCWDTNADGIDETCTGPFVGSGTTGGQKTLPVDAFVEVPGTTGTFTAVDP